MNANVGLGSSILSRVKNRLWGLPSALVLLWVFVLLWGERFVFQRNVDQCLWRQWESWPAHAQPYHVLLVADPQLVDPHTYPDRPWPLSSLTVLYTDLYLKRAYGHLQARLRPDATLFLGDLFDGGREWGTTESTSPETRYRQYGTQFWMKEYLRFSNIFLRPWYIHGPSATRSEPAGRRLLASLPGNHDLGFAAGIQLPVKERFDAYFGPMNRVDIIGNHSLVHLDTVSLSAMDQADPNTGSSGAGDGSATATASSKIWRPVEDFLVDSKSLRAKAIQHACETKLGWKNPHPHPKMSPWVQAATNTSDPDSRPRPQLRVGSSQFPTILLSHVPLYRTGATSCGPMRERGTAIPLQAGYQYQNVLTPLISQDIVKHLTAEEITMIYSGDDHDYCEIEHNEFTGRIKEITVKSMSWAMGIRLPGVQLASLWNPVDVDKVMSGDGSSPSTPRDTVQNRLCLLPDQLGIFIRYGQVLGLTLVALVVGAVRHKPSAAADSHHDKSEPLLPIASSHRHGRGSNTSQTSAVMQNGQAEQQHLSTRKMGGYGHVPATSRTSSPSKPAYPEDEAEGDDWGVPARTSAAYATQTGPRRGRRQPRSRLAHFARSLGNTAWPVLLFYAWLLWSS